MHLVRFDNSGTCLVYFWSFIKAVQYKLKEFYLFCVNGVTECRSQKDYNEII